MKNKRIISIIGIVVLIAAFIGLYFVFGPKATEGTKSYMLTVVDDSGEKTLYTGKTDAEYLRDLMDELKEETEFTYEGEDQEYGLYIESVNGIVADYNTDGAYWAIYVNGEYGMYGADSQPVSDGDEYQLVYEVYVS